MEISVTGFKSESNYIKLIGTLRDNIMGRVMPKPRLYIYILVSILNAVRYDNWALIMKTKHVSVCDVLPIVKTTGQNFRNVKL